MRLAQVEREALSHRFPRERTKKVFFRVSMFRVLFLLYSISSLLCVVDNKLFCALPLVL